MALHPVIFAAARFALHRSARSKGYKLSREGADPRSPLRGGVCVDVVVLIEVKSIRLPALNVAPASPFIAFKERAQVTFVVKR
jgi:hypothetical protein